MSDLFCAASVVVAPLAGADVQREQAESLATVLADRNVALVYTAPADPVGGDVAGRLRCPVRVVDALGGTDDEALADALGDVVDLHRGETVLVLARPEALAVTLPRLVADLPDAAAPTVGRGIDLLADADGWRRDRGGR
jgi:hypothetical protein